MSQAKRRSNAQAVKATLEPLSQAALQIVDDMGLLYQYPETGRNGCFGYWVSFELAECFALPQPGEVLVIATRNSALRESFCLDLVQYQALQCKQRLTLCRMDRPMLNFLRDLIDLMSGIPSEASIYDWQLNEEEFSRLSDTLNELGKAQVYFGQGKYAELAILCDTVTKHEVERGGDGLVLVDNVQSIRGGAWQIDTLAALHKLKELAARIKSPVIALYQLDDTVRLPEFILTRQELAFMERISVGADGVVLMGGVPGNLLFQPPKIPKRNSPAKQASQNREARI